MDQDTVVFTQAINFEKLAVSSTAVGLTATEYKNVNTVGAGQQLIDARVALVTVDGTAGTNDVRYTLDGTTPTADTGHLLASGKSLVIRGYGNITRARFIRAGSDTTLQVTYFG